MSNPKDVPAFPRWYIKIVVRIALALFDHINLKVIGFESETLITRTNGGYMSEEDCKYCKGEGYVYAGVLGKTKCLCEVCQGTGTVEIED